MFFLLATWINETFKSFDYAILNFMHNIGESTDFGITFFWEFISLLAEKGLGPIILSFILIGLSFIPKVRGKIGDYHTNNIRLIGLTAIIGIAFGGLFTNIAIKNVVARPRPYVDTSGIYNEWWQLVGSHLSREFSFPSGHTTATMALMTSFFLYCNKKYSWMVFLFVILMGMSRMYLMMHYPTDIIGGIIVGGISSLIAYALLKLINKNKKTTS